RDDPHRIARPQRCFQQQFQQGALRLALERPGKDSESRAALITPDRNLARRVMAELSSFGIIADDSAGTPLSAMPQGT
ncbi:hypothetical protein AB9F39_39130, partial [Rhizobium leguminosarum]|uniref:hypothetical protein n=1 Tax=Rhizobium leguminosarum TaxID=384 RepID=UPI003F9AB0A9